MDFCEGDEGFVCVGSSGKTAKVSAMPSPEKPLLLTPKKDKVPVLLSFLPNETALVTDSEVDSDTNETFHDAETMPGEAHASMPPSPLSPRRAWAGGPNPGPARALVAGVITPTAATTAQPSPDAHTQPPPPPLQPAASASDTAPTDNRAANSSRPSILILFRSYHIPALPFHGP